MQGLPVTRMVLGAGGTTVLLMKNVAVVVQSKNGFFEDVED